MVMYRDMVICRGVWLMVMYGGVWRCIGVYGDV